MFTRTRSRAATKAAQTPSQLSPPAPKPDLLARGYLDILVRKEGAAARPLLRKRADPDDPVEIMLDDLADSTSATVLSLRPDLAAVAVLTARAIEAERGLARRLRRAAPVVTIATHTADTVDLVRQVVEHCAFPGDTSVQTTPPRTQPHSSWALVMARTGTNKDDKPDVGNGAVAMALHGRAPLVGIAPDPRRQLPRDLMRACDVQLVLPLFDQDALALVVEAVTGRRPTRPLDPAALRVLDVSDLTLAVSSDRDPDRCLERLEAVAAKRSEYLGAGPTLEELEGYGEAKTWGLDLAADLQALRSGALDWGSVDHKGLLLSGPPGVGKTQFAGALAKSAQVPLVATSVAEWNSASYLSGTLQAMRNSFAEARRLAPCILFIDEVDGIYDRAKLKGEFVEYWSQIINLFLELLAGIEDRPGVVVVAATNHADRIDPAVKRAGRLDREIAIEKPDTPTLRRIFRYHLGGLLPDAELMPLALAARGCTGADVEAYVRRAKGASRRQRRPLALDDVMAELRASRPVLPAVDRRRFAVHEAGHVVAGRALCLRELRSVGLHDDGASVTYTTPVGGAATLDDIEAEIAQTLAGRVAEELVLGSGCAGAGLGDDSDLAQATRMAAGVELRFGLGSLGLVHVPQRDNEVVVVPGLHEAVRRRLAAGAARAREVLTAHRAALDLVAEVLEREGWLERDDVERLWAQAAPDVTATPDPTAVANGHPPTGTAPTDACASAAA